MENEEIIINNIEEFQVKIPEVDTNKPFTWADMFE